MQIAEDLQAKDGARRPGIPASAEWDDAHPPSAEISLRGRRLPLHGLRFFVVLALVQWVALAVTGLASGLAGPREPFGGDWQELVNGGTDLVARLESIWQRWDALWYQHVAMAGYAPHDGTTAFYPLYPFLAMVLALPSGNVVRAELVVSAIAAVGAMWFLWKLCRLEFLGALPDAAGGLDGRRIVAVPLLTVLITALFPTGFFLLAPYTEGLFLCLSLASFWLLRRGRFWSAGIVGLLASGTRAQGALLALPIAYEYLRTRGTFDWIRRHGGRPPGIVLAAAVMPVAGALAFAAYQASQAAGQVGAGALAPWGLTLVMPWQAVSASLDYIGRNLGKPTATIEALNLVTLVLAFVIAIVGIRRLPLAYSMYAIPTLGLYFFRTVAFSPLMSVSRYVLVVFPCFMLVGLWLGGRPRLAAAWIVFSFASQLVLFQYWVRWGFVA